MTILPKLRRATDKFLHLQNASSGIAGLQQRIIELEAELTSARANAVPVGCVAVCRKCQTPVQDALVRCERGYLPNVVCPVRDPVEKTLSGHHMRYSHSGGWSVSSRQCSHVVSDATQKTLCGRDASNWSNIEWHAPDCDRCKKKLESMRPTTHTDAGLGH
jgi:hypothetical protein